MSSSEKPPTSNPLASIPPALRTKKAKTVGTITLVLALLGVGAEYWPVLKDVLSVFCYAADVCSRP